MKLTRSTIFTGVAALVLLAAIPSAIQDTFATGRIYLLDVVAQFLIFQQVHPGAALLIGPLLITAPYAFARAMTNRAARMIGRSASP